MYYTCGSVAAAAGFGLYSYYVRDSYYVRELLAALTLFSVAFFFLALLLLALLLAWFVSRQAANWAGLASRTLMQFSRHLIATYARI